ncbi:MAG: hypothetical protein KAT69_07905 [Candidatus Aminicenantes bacterium]|nr:hypothetical protein [Candidatus Aminicenantes bacterium]
MNGVIDMGEMNQINNEVKEAVETTSYVVQAMIDLWNSLPVAVTAFILIMAVTSLLMQWVKKAILVNKSKKEKVRLLWVFGMPIGIAISYGGYALTKGMLSDVFWIMYGLSVSTVAMGVHMVSTNYILPGIKKFFEFLIDTGYMMIMRKPRKKNGNSN